MAAKGLTPAECAEKIAGAEHVVVLTGAGISTAAGVPDFRGPKGLYVTRQYDPETVFEISHFDRDPKPFYGFSRDFLKTIAAIEPTFTHLFLAKLADAGKNVAVVTQNIDGLHQRAGSKAVYPMHGDYETACCRECGKKIGGAELRALMDAADVPRCPCGGVIKPDVVFFGENVRYLAEAERLAATSDLMLVLGSSLAVYPAALIPEYAGGEVVVVNRGRTGVRSGSSVFVVDADLDDYFRSVAAYLKPGL